MQNSTSTNINILAIAQHKMLKAITTIIITDDVVEDINIIYKVGELVNYDHLSFNMTLETTNLSEAIKAYNSL